MTFLSALRGAVARATLMTVPFAQPAFAEGGSVALTSGLMTTNTIADVLAPGATEFSGSAYSGVVFGYEMQVGQSNWDVGVEFQANLHYGHGSYGEFVVPLTARYSPPAPWIDRLDSYAFGLGLSHATDIPQVEIDATGDSQRTMVYLLFETAFSVGSGNDDVFFRLHHRSDGYGLFPVDSGSNALAVGIRRRF